MPRRLSNPEWLAFQNSVDLNALQLPPWGAVVLWGSQYILVYICPESGSLCMQGEAMLSDITDRADLIKNLPSTFDASQSVWIYHIVPETMTRIVEVSKTTLETTGQIVQTVAQTAGEVAGELTGPLLENLALPLVVVAIVFLMLYGPKR